MRKRKLIALAVALIALALGAGFIGAASSAPSSGANIYGTGAGSIELGGQARVAQFSFTAHTGPKGDFGSSRIVINNPSVPLDARVNVDCVNVFPNPPGNGAWFEGPVTRVTPQPNTYGIAPGDQLLFGINDYSEPPGLPPDEYDAYAGLRLPPQFCKQLGPIQQVPITQGNIVINLG